MEMRRKKAHIRVHLLAQHPADALWSIIFECAQSSITLTELATDTVIALQLQTIILITIKLQKYYNCLLYTSDAADES